MAKGKNSSPYLRGKRGRYYCWIEGRLRSLRTDKPKVAEARYRVMLAEWKEERERERRESAPRPLTVRECFDLYLVHAARFKSGIKDRRRVLDDFAATGAGALPHPELTPEHLERWLSAHPDWARSTARTRIKHVLAAFGFCLKRRRIASNPLAGIDKPPWERRRAAISPEDEAAVYGASRGPFRSILTALRETGARPSELCRTTVSDYRSGVIVLDIHKTDEGGEPRVIHLTPGVRAEVERLIGDRTEGPIWRNARGRPWTPDTLYCRFKRLRVRLGLGEGVFPYSMRGGFITRGIEAGVDLITMSNMVGHTDLSTMKKHYARMRRKHYDEAMSKINPPPADGEEPPTSPSSPASS